MPWRGINVIVHNQEMIRLCRMVESNLNKPTWVNTLSFDKTKDNKMTTEWKKIQTNPSLLKTILNRKEISFYEVDKFIVKGKVIDVHELYQTEEKIKSVFFRKKEMNSSSLLVVGSKTPKELISCGPYLPLFITISNNTPTILNSR